MLRGRSRQPPTFSSPLGRRHDRPCSRLRCARLSARTLSRCRRLRHCRQGLSRQWSFSPSVVKRPLGRRCQWRPCFRSQQRHRSWHHFRYVSRCQRRFRTTSMAPRRWMPATSQQHLRCWRASQRGHRCQLRARSPRVASLGWPLEVSPSSLPRHQCLQHLRFLHSQIRLGVFVGSSRHPQAWSECRA